MTSSISKPVRLGKTITIAEVYNVAYHGVAVTLQPAERDRLVCARDRLDRAIAAGTTVYGANTGIGALCETRIDKSAIDELQVNLLCSHAAAMGPELGLAQSRGLLVVRAHTLALGQTGVSAELVEQLAAFINRGLTPVVPARGSVGASGDLAPLAHLALPLIGEGYARVGDERLDGAQALARVGLKPLALRPKEGLSLINGTQLTAALGALALYDAAELIAASDVVGALSLDAHLGSCRVCDRRIHQAKPHQGQQRSAAVIEFLIKGSALNASHSNCGRVQDAYSFRCMPQVHGAVRDAHGYARTATTVEINSVSDNPLILENDDGSDDVLSGGNFHAASVAMPLDHMTAALTTLATMSERRVARMVNADTSRGLPAFLADRPGLQSGYMMPQVIASSLASECKTLSFPACVDTIPTSAGQEDHVSMGPIAAHKLGRVVDNLARVLAIEAAVAARALDLRSEATSGPLQDVQALIRRYCAPFGGDRSMAAELEQMADAILRGELRQAAGLALTDLL